MFKYALSKILETLERSEPIHCEKNLVITTYYSFNV